MPERRFENRMLCADMVQVKWKNSSGAEEVATGLLEDIAATGACLQMDVAIAPDTPIQITYGQVALDCEVKYCSYREIGYFIGLQFPPDHRWSRHLFRPKHLLDLEQLGAH